jgi:hypothetical protein
VPILANISAKLGFREFWRANLIANICKFAKIELFATIVKIRVPILAATQLRIFAELSDLGKNWQQNFANLARLCKFWRLCKTWHRVCEFRDPSAVRDSALSQVKLLQRTDTARQWPGTSAASDLREGTRQRHFLQRHLRTDGPVRCRWLITYLRLRP